MFEFVFQLIKDNIKREEGQAMAEYGVILALIAAVCVAAIVTLGGYVHGAFSALNTALSTVTGI